MVRASVRYVTLLVLFADVIVAKIPHKRSHLESPGIPLSEVQNGKKTCLHKSSTCEDISACCEPLVRCPAHVRRKDGTRCSTPEGGVGVCCTTGSNHTELLDIKRRKHHMIKADTHTLGVVSRISKAQLAELKTREAKLMSSGKPSILSRSSASYSHIRNSRTFNAADLHQVMNIAGRALGIAIAT